MKLRDNNHNNFETVLRRVTKQSGIVFLGKIIFILSGLVSSILLARLLGVSLLGRYQLGFVTVQVISIFCIAGLDKGLIRFIPIFELTDRGKIRKALIHNLLISFIISLLLSALLNINAPSIAENFFHSSEMIEVLRIFSFMIPVFAIYRIFSASLIGLKRADVESNIRNILTPVFFVLSLGIILIIGGNLYEVIAIRIVSYIFAILFFLGFIFSKYMYIFKEKSTEYNFKEFISFSIPLLLIGLLYYLMGHTDILMLGYFASEREVGIYSVVVRIAVFIILGLEIISQTIEPNISELAAKNDFKSMEALLKVLTKWIFYISLFTFVLIIIYRTEMLAVFGHSFTEGSTALVILAFGQLINAFAGPTGKILVMTGKQKWEVFNSVSMLTLNVILNILLIPKYGITGAAIATTASLSIINVLKLLETYKEFKIHPYSFRYLKGIIAIMSGAGIVYCFHRLFNLVQLNIVISVVLGTSIFLSATLIILYLLKLDHEDKIIFDMYARKLLTKSLS